MSILLYLLVLVFVILSRDVAAEGAGTEKAENIYQLSKQKDLLNQPVRMTAALIECLNGSVCQQKVVVNAWLSLEDITPNQILIIDELLDPVKQTKVEILHPYLIRVILQEPVLMYPLHFEKAIKYESTCVNVNNASYLNNSSGIYRRATTVGNQGNNYVNMFYELYNDEDSIKRDLRNYVEESRLKNSEKQNDELLVYVDEKNDTTHANLMISEPHSILRQQENELKMKIDSTEHHTPPRPILPSDRANNGQELFNHEEFASTNFAVNKLVGTASNVKLNENIGWRPAVSSSDRWDITTQHEGQDIQSTVNQNSFVGAYENRQNLISSRRTGANDGPVMTQKTNSNYRKSAKYSEMPPYFTLPRLHWQFNEQPVNLQREKQAEEIDGGGHSEISSAGNGNFNNEKLGTQKSSLRDQYRFRQPARLEAEAIPVSKQQQRHPTDLQRGHLNSFANPEFRLSRDEYLESIPNRFNELNDGIEYDGSLENYYDDNLDHPEYNSPYKSIKTAQKAPKIFKQSNYNKRLPRRFIDSPELRQVFSDHNLTVKDQIGFLDSLSKTPKLDKKLKEAEKVFEPSAIFAKGKRTKRSFDLDKLYLEDDDYFDGLGGILGETIEPKGKSSTASNLQNEKLIKANQGADKKEEKHIKDIWYSVYSISAPSPLISTKIQIWRKQSKEWQIVEEVNLTNSSANNYVNKSLLISFSSHLQIESAYTLDYTKIKLLVPNIGNDTINSSNLDKFMAFDDTLLKVTENGLEGIFCHLNEESNLSKRSVAKLKTIGKFPKQRQVIGACVDGSEELCLSLVDESKQSYKLTVEFPFENNQILDDSPSTVKITNIFADTSAQTNLQAQFTFISMAHYVSNFQVELAKCDLLSHLNVSETVTLPPNEAVTINVNIPLRLYNQHKKTQCEVIVKDGKNRTVAKRDFPIDPGLRCLCVSICACICFPAMLTTEASKLCEKMTPQDGFNAGFLNSELEEYDMEDTISLEPRVFIAVPICVCIFLLLMGCTKGLLGCCVPGVGNWKYDYLQPNRSYDEAGRCSRFILNCMFFFLYPFRCCCCCFFPTDRDRKRSTSSIYGRSVIMKELTDLEDESDDDEKRHLLNVNSSQVYSFDPASSQTLFNILDESDVEERLDKDAGYVINAYNQSHENLRKLDGHHSEINVEDDPRFDEASNLVKQLADASIVYRIFNKSVGNVLVDDFQNYSIRGYFMPMQNTGYQFMSYTTIKQYWTISNPTILQPLIPPILLDSKSFRRVYKTKIDVLDANDLLLSPTQEAPCINVHTQDLSRYDTAQ